MTLGLAWSVLLQTSRSSSATASTRSPSVGRTPRSCGRPEATVGCRQHHRFAFPAEKAASAGSRRAASRCRQGWTTTTFETEGGDVDLGVVDLLRDVAWFRRVVDETQARAPCGPRSLGEVLHEVAAKAVRGPIALEARGGHPQPGGQRQPSRNRRGDVDLGVAGAKLVELRLCRLESVHNISIDPDGSDPSKRSGRRGTPRLRSVAASRARCTDSRQTPRQEWPPRCEGAAPGADSDEDRCNSHSVRCGGAGSGVPRRPGLYRARNHDGRGGHGGRQKRPPCRLTPAACPPIPPHCCAPSTTPTP